MSALDNAPFPVQVPYRVNSDLSKLEGSPLKADEKFPMYLAQKLSSLAGRPDSLLLPKQALDPQIWQEIGEALWSQVKADQAESVKSLGFKTSVLNDTENDFRDSPPCSQQHAWAKRLTLSIQEDWVLVSPQGHFEAGSVCFPSAWVPSEKFRLPLAAIHAPVADGEALRKASQALVRAMLQKGPFQRFVWTLTRNGGLAKHPSYVEDLQAESDRALYFRSERQTTLALPKSGRALFLIRIYVEPLETILKSGPDRLTLLQASLKSMSDAVIAYKGLLNIREQVLGMRPI
jgi:hypothetical protein